MPIHGTLGSLTGSIAQTVTGGPFKDEDNLGSNSATHVATQQSIKAYVDAQVTAQDLDFQGDSGGALSIDLDSEALSIVGVANEIYTSGASNTIQIGLPTNVTLGGNLTVGGNIIKASDGGSTITMDTSDNVTVAGDITAQGGAMLITGGTPTLTIGDGGTEDTKIDFAGNVEDYYIGLRDADDSLHIGVAAEGQATVLGTKSAIVINSGSFVEFPKGLRHSPSVFVGTTDADADSLNRYIKIAEHTEGLSAGTFAVASGNFLVTMSGVGGSTYGIFMTWLVTVQWGEFSNSVTNTPPVTKISARLLDSSESDDEGPMGAEHFTLTYNGVTEAAVWVKSPNAYVSVNISHLGGSPSREGGDVPVHATSGASSGWVLCDSTGDMDDWQSSITSLGVNQVATYASQHVADLHVENELLVSGSLKLGSISATSILDEDAMGTNSATALATQQSIKAYVDAQTHGSTLTTEQVQDIVGNMVDDTETGIDVTYDDTNGNLEFAVDVSDFLSNGANNRIVTATGADAMNAEGNLTFDGSTLTVTGDLAVTGGDITLTSAATDIDLIDHNASALSFDASGKAGILEIDTTNSAEKVKMSGGLTVDGDVYLKKGVRNGLSVNVTGIPNNDGDGDWAKILEFTTTLDSYDAPEFTAIVTLSPMGYSSGAGVGNTQQFLISGRFSRQDTGVGDPYEAHMYLAAEPLNGATLDGWDPSTHLKLTYNGTTSAAVWIGGTSNFTNVHVTLLGAHDGTDAGNYDPTGIWAPPDAAAWTSFSSLGADIVGAWANKTFSSLKLGSVTATSILDEDAMGSNSATALSTQQSIKAYVDATVQTFDIDALGALGGSGLHQTQDHFLFSDNGTEKKITFSNLQDAVFAGVSGDAAVAAGGALTLASNAVDSAEIAAGAVDDAHLSDGVATGLAGTASSTGLSASSGVLSVSDLHPVGVNGSNNQLITDDGDGTVTSESGLTYDGSTLYVDGDLKLGASSTSYQGITNGSGKYGIVLGEGEYVAPHMWGYQGSSTSTVREIIASEVWGRGLTTAAGVGDYGNDKQVGLIVHGNIVHLPHKINYPSPIESNGTFNTDYWTLGSDANCATGDSITGYTCIKFDDGDADNDNRYIKTKYKLPHGLDYNVQMYQIAHGTEPPDGGEDIAIQTSTDGSSWTTRQTLDNATYSQTPTTYNTFLLADNIESADFYIRIIQVSSGTGNDDWEFTNPSIVDFLGGGGSGGAMKLISPYGARGGAYTYNDFIEFRANDGTELGQITNSVAAPASITYNAFTGGHDMYVSDAVDQPKFGRIMSIIQTHLRGSEPVYETKMSEVSLDPAVIGLSGDDGPKIPKPGSFSIEGLNHWQCNSVGNSRIWVCSEEGNISIGDYICSSNTMGTGMKQPDNILRNYTVAKSTEAVDWSAETKTVTTLISGSEETGDAVYETSEVAVTEKLITCTLHCG